MEVKIISFSQQTSIDDGSTSNFITCLMSNGEAIEAMVTEESLKKLINARWGVNNAQGQQGAAKPSAQASDLEFQQDDSGESAMVFGSAEAPAPQPRQPTRSVTVPMNEYGYPIVEQRQSDQGSITPDEDEDGVSQL